jgi:transposase
MGMNRHELTNAQWARLEPLLPPERSGKPGRPFHDHRRTINSILWLLKTGVPWRDLPARFGPWKTVANRFYRWRQAGIWQRVFAALLQQADQVGSLDWKLQFVDSTTIRVHQHAAGARTGADEAVGRSRGGLTTKVHLRADGHGRPVAMLLTAGHRHDTTAFIPLLQASRVKRPGRGRPRSRPQRIVADKGHTSRHIRRYCRQHGISTVIPVRRNQRPNRHFDRDAYRERNQVERLVNRFKQFRRVATRYEKRGVNYLAMVTLAAVTMWL